MDFFQQQDTARRNARLLVVLFSCAVLALIFLTNLLVAALLFFSEDYNVYSGSGGLEGFLAVFSWTRFGTIGLAVTATIALVILCKWVQLSRGGKVVAETLGGVRIVPQTDDRAEQRCLNVVAEMALAANMPVPAVYLLERERGINAFAAGIVPADAVIAVTRGCIDHLDRRELQGVIAHEFSHILNGDMRLNIRLAAMLKGITFIGDVGHMLLRSSNRVRTGLRNNRSGGAALPALGLALWLLGLLGGLAAGFIKAAISRQKEYLADASAVQFTRDNTGIADALKVIGGYVPGTLVHAARAAEMSHIFFGQVEHHLWQVFATHPPLCDRIRRIQPHWDGQYIKRKPKHYANSPGAAAAAGLGRASIVAAAMAAATEAVPATAEQDARFDKASDFAAETAAQQQLPVALVRHSHEPLGAQALVCALLASPCEAVFQRQLQVLSASGVRGLAELTLTVQPAVQALGAPKRLPLLELCLPALRAMSLRQYRTLKNNLLQLIQADAHTALHEWCLFQLTRHYLDPSYIQVKPSAPRYSKLTKVRRPLRVVLSTLAYESATASAAAFRLGVEALDQGQLTIIPSADLSVAMFSKAVHDLAQCYPLLKPRILKAMTLAAGADGRVSAEEREVVAAMAAVMDCPLPGYLQG